MRKDMNIAMHNDFLNASTINRGFHELNFAVKGNEEQKGIERKDTVSISPLGKAKSLIESLVKQKEKIIENKNELIGRTLENGGNMDSIKTKLEAFEEQVQNIDNQIAQITSDQLKQQAEEQKKAAYKKPKTEEEVQTERLHSMVSMSSSLDQAKVVSSVKTKVDGETKVLQIEIKLDASRRGASMSKYERLADLKNKSSDLSIQVGENLGKVYEEIKDVNDHPLTEPKYSETIKNKDLDSEIRDKRTGNSEDKTDDKDNKIDSDVKKKRKE